MTSFFRKVTVLLTPLIVSLTILGVSGNVEARLTPKQIEIANMAYNQATKDGHPNPEILPGIVGVESNIGIGDGVKHIKPLNRAFYGICQIKYTTAKSVLDRFPSLYEKYSVNRKSSADIKIALITNDAFNLDVASKYLLILRKSYGFGGIKPLANAYNQGPGGGRHVGPNFRYGNAVVKNIHRVSTQISRSE